MLSTLEQLLITSLNTALAEPEVEAVPGGHLRFITEPGISLRVIELINDLPDPHEAKDMLLRQPVGRVNLDAGRDDETAGERTAVGGEDQQPALAGYEETVPVRINLEVFAWDKGSTEADALLRPALANVLAEFVRQEVIDLDPAEEAEEEPALSVHFRLYNPVLQVRRLQQTVQAIKDSQLYWHVSRVRLLLSADLRMLLFMPDEVADPERIGKISGQMMP